VILYAAVFIRGDNKNINYPFKLFDKRRVKNAIEVNFPFQKILRYLLLNPRESWWPENGSHKLFDGNHG
jgi:hypothetical protein